jgi:hypothetical protein
MTREADLDPLQRGRSDGRQNMHLRDCLAAFTQFILWRPRSIVAKRLKHPHDMSRSCGIGAVKYEGPEYMLSRVRASRETMP